MITQAFHGVSFRQGGLIPAQQHQLAGLAQDQSGDLTNNLFNILGPFRSSFFIEYRYWFIFFVICLGG
jgi:hypothetical protein